MKRTVFLLNVLAVFMCHNACYSQNEETNKAKTLELTASLGGSGRFLDSIEVIYVATTLYNPTDDTLNFVSMSCSYEDLFTTNTDTFNVQCRYDCYGNYPIVVALPPKTKTDRYIMVTRTIKGKNAEAMTFRVGLYFLEYKYGETYKNIILSYNSRQDAPVIWSNELELKRLYKTNY